MKLSSNRLISGILSIILLAFSIYLVFKLSLNPSANTPFYLNLIAVIISSLNIYILLAWMTFGIPTGIAVSIVSIMMAVWLDLRMGFSRYTAFMLPFFIATFIGYKFVLSGNSLKRLYVLKSEKLNEEANILLNDIEEKKKRIFSIEEKLRRYFALRGVVESLSAFLSLDEIKKSLIEKTLNTIGKSGRILLFSVDTDKQELKLLGSKGDIKIMTKKGDLFDKWVLRHRKSLIVEDLTRDFRFSDNDTEESRGVFRSLIAAPMISEDKVMGILRIDSPYESSYTQDDLRLLDIIANLGAVAIQNSSLYSRTQELAIKDTLTGLVIRRYFLERFQEEMRRSARKKGALSLLMLDIDHFKDYNDKYGHTAGDLVLKHLAGVVSSMVREGDVVARYGGEEMIVLLCGRNKKKALAEAEEIRKAVEDKPLMLRRQSSNITVSIGLASYPEDAVLEEELVRIADENLYKAKKQGRNRVCST